MAISFFGTKGEFGWLSNFSQYGFVLDGYVWFTNEHFYQANKFTPGGEKFIAIKDAPSAAKAKELGNVTEGEQIRGDWKEYMRVHTMRRGLRAKFSQNPELKEKLMATAGEELVETNPRDEFWGTGKTGSGDNMLGQLLIQLREEFLRNNTAIPTSVEA